MARVGHVQVQGIGIHRAHLLPHLVLRVTKVYTVAKALRHLLLAIRTGQAAGSGILRKHDVRLDQDGSISIVESVHQLSRNLKHRLLIFANRHCRGLEQRDVCGL